MSAELLAAFAALYHEKLEAEGRVEEMKKRLAAMQEPLLTFISEQGWKTLPRFPGVTVYIDTRSYAKARDGDTAAANAMLKANPLTAAFVSERFNSATLASWVRECARNGTPLPAGFTDHIEVTEQVQLQARRTG